MQQSAQRAYHDETDENQKSFYENHGEEYIKQNDHDHEKQNDTVNDNYEYYESNDNDSEIDEKSEMKANIFFLQTSNTRIRKIIYKRCGEQHSSRNKLHKHFKSCKIVSKLVTSHHDEIIISTVYHDESEILHSDVLLKQSQKLNFRF